MRRTRHLGPYQLLHRVASGGMAEVYRARLDRADVAIKRLLPRYNDDDEFIVMLTDEARIIARFDHPNIVRLFELGLADEQHFLAMEFVDGVDLRSLLRRLRERGSEPPPAAMALVVEQALWGLHAAHVARDEHGRALEVVHRDFSPSNILVGFDGTVKLTDFGIAKARMNRARTRGGMIKGKVKYMSPEQTEGRRLGPASDVFAAGVVLYQAMTGQMPFAAASDVALMEVIRAAEPARPSAWRRDLDEAFDDLLARALQKAPDARHLTAAAFAADLHAWRVSRWPESGHHELGALVQTCFARERAEASRALDELADHSNEESASHPSRATSAHTQYTRLVEAAWGTGSWPASADPAARAKAWLASRRAVQPPSVHQTRETRCLWIEGGSDDPSRAPARSGTAAAAALTDALPPEVVTASRPPGAASPAWPREP